MPEWFNVLLNGIAVGNLGVSMLYLRGTMRKRVALRRDIAIVRSLMESAMEASAPRVAGSPCSSSCCTTGTPPVHLMILCGATPDQRVEISLCEACAAVLGTPMTVRAEARS